MEMYRYTREWRHAAQAAYPEKVIGKWLERYSRHTIALTLCKCVFVLMSPKGRKRKQQNKIYLLEHIVVLQ